MKHYQPLLSTINHYQRLSTAIIPYLSLCQPIIHYPRIPWPLLVGDCAAYGGECALQLEPWQSGFGEYGWLSVI